MGKSLNNKQKIGSDWKGIQRSENYNLVILAQSDLSKYEIPNANKTKNKSQGTGQVLNSTVT